MTIHNLKANLLAAQVAIELKKYFPSMIIDITDIDGIGGIRGSFLRLKLPANNNLWRMVDYLITETDCEDKDASVIAKSIIRRFELHTQTILTNK